MELKVEDLKVDIFRRPGLGGWSVQPDNAVRITHLPSGIYVEEWEDRSAHRNRAVAMDKIKPLIEEFDESQLPIGKVTSELEEVKAKLAKAMEALELADGIMGFSRGDAYEREGTQKDYDKFNELWDDLSGAKEAREREYAAQEAERQKKIQAAAQKAAAREASKVDCPQCGKTCIGQEGLAAHQEAKHLVKLKLSSFKTLVKDAKAKEKKNG